MKVNETWTRRALLGALCKGSAALAAGSAWTGCEAVMGSIVPDPATSFRTMQGNARPLAYQSYAFIYSFADGNSAQWLATLDAVERDALPFLKALREAGVTCELSVTPRDAGQGILHYVVDATFPGRKGSTTLPGTPGTDPTVYAAAAAKAAKQTGLAADLLQRGHFALYGMVNMMTGLNAESVTLKRHAFALLVLKERVKNGERADWFDPNRPAEETNRDVDEAITLIAHDQDRVAAERGTIMTMTALAAAYPTEGSIAQLKTWIQRSRAATQQWRASHTRPQPDDFGVKAAKLPTPQDVMAELEERFGFVSSVAKIAMGVATGNVSNTLEGIAELMPEDSTAQIALVGLSAAASGDIDGTLTAVAEVAGFTEEYSDLKSTLNVLQQIKPG